MIAIYCNDHHEAVGKELCDKCQELFIYANQRLDKCPFAQDKPACSKCTIHCYSPQMQKVARQVMRYSGPKMPKKHPILAILHLWDRMFI